VHVTRRYPWEPRLAELLQSFERPLEVTGAELEITYPDGSVGVWPLARHYRIEEGEDGLTTLWLRPVTGGYDNPSGDPARAFSLAAMRRHAFCVDELHAEGEALVCPLPNEGRLVIRPVSPGSAGRSSTPGTASATSTSTTPTSTRSPSSPRTAGTASGSDARSLTRTRFSVTRRRGLLLDEGARAARSQLIVQPLHRVDGGDHPHRAAASPAGVQTLSITAPGMRMDVRSAGVVGVHSPSPRQALHSPRAACRRSELAHE
jgi:hypothetical protein